MLHHWLGTTTLATFRARHFQRQPFAQPSTVADPSALLSWDIVAAVVAADPAPDILVVAGGKILPFPPPRSIDEVRAYLRIGVGFCMRGTERCHPALSRVADNLCRDLGISVDSVQIQLFVTSGGTYGFGWHYDDEDVFIVQTAGIKDYYFRANSVAPDVPAAPGAFGRYSEETSLLRTAKLVAGDFLYLPRRWWHMAVCSETGLSVSVGARLSQLRQ